MGRELKPCPFCGSDSQFVQCRSGKSYGKFRHFVTIRCNVCGGQCGTTTVAECPGGCKGEGDFCKYALDAIDTTEIKWNMRIKGADQ